MPNMRVITDGLEFPEGPVVMPDGSVILVEIARETLTRVMPDGKQHVIATGPSGNLRPEVISLCGVVMVVCPFPTCP